ncbi:hypothetical protein G9P44_002858 [Scheffersomyces stipitis]|nr:hypothetical protein G9P44_002858 [Scheffersomyces stipitis]
MYPYIYFVIKNFNIVNDDANVFIYSGYLGAAFALTQFISTSFWIKASSRFGKKSARLYASTGTAFSMVLYGLSTNLYMALLARSPHKLDGQEIMVGQLLLDNKMESPEMDNCATKSDTPKVYLPGVEDLSQEDSETEEERELLSPILHFLLEEGSIAGDSFFPIL